MNSIELLSMHDLPNVKLEDVLNNCLDSEWSDSQVDSSRYEQYSGARLLKDIRDSKTKRLNKNLQDLLKKEIDPLIKQYSDKLGIDISVGEGYQLVKYNVGQFFAEHVDQTEDFPRKISAILYLNDNYEGGTITFTKINHTIKPMSNTLLIFPSTEDFEHSADPVTSGVKYVIVGFWS